MSNDFYNVSGAPSQGSFGSSATIRAEFAALQAGFDKLPVLAANNSKLLRVNSSASGLEAFTHDFLTTAAAAAAYVAKAGDTMTGSLGVGGAPTYRLDVASPASSIARFMTTNVGGGALRFGTDTNVERGYIGSGSTLFVGGASNEFGMDAVGILVLSTGGNKRLSIGGSGNVTINAPSSGAAFRIVDQNSGRVTALLTQAPSDANFSLAAYNGVVGGSSGTKVAYFGLQYEGTGPSAGFNFYRGSGATDSYLSVLTNNTERISVNNAGNVAVNAPSSGTTLAITGISGNNHQTWSDGTVTVGVQTAGGTAAYIGTTTAHRFELFTSNTSRLTIDSAGKFGFNGSVGTDQVTFNAANIGFNAGTSLTQINNWGSNDLEIVTRNAASNLKFYSGNGQLAMTLTPNKIVLIPGPSDGSSALAVDNAVSGNVVSSLIANRSNTASSQARLWIYVEGASAADPFIRYDVNGATIWSHGIDNSDSDAFKISNGATLGTSDRLRIATTGTVDISAGSGNLLMGGNITRFESAELTCPSGAAGTTSVAHGGPRAPDVVYAVLRCKTAELNWAVGDEVDLGSDFDGSTAVGNYIAANATTCYFGSSNTPAIRNRTTLNLGTVTPANWKVVFKCLWF